MGYFNENMRLQKLASLMISDYGRRIDFTSKSFETSDSSSDDDYDMFGMSEDDQYELMCQGIKPWDPCALDALLVLNGGFDDW